jgi:hypothetical protein
VPSNQTYDNAFKAEWELFLQYLAGERDAFPWDLWAGAKGVQLAMLGLESWRERRMLDVGSL